MKEKKISSQMFHQWKQHDCTKALFCLINESIKATQEAVNTHVSAGEIDINFLYTVKGSLKTLHEIKECISDKEILNTFGEENEKS